MKRLKTFLVASAVTLSAMFSSAWCNPALEVKAIDSVSIMPIGDSITFGYGEDGGYRKYLDYALKSKGITFDMVGPEGRNSEQFNYNGQTCQYDGNHAGYSGFTIKQQYPIPSWGENGLLERLKNKDAVKNAQPDIVLLIIGTNDMTANRDLSACEQDLHTLVDYITGDMSEGGMVFMGSIPDFTAYGGNAQRVANYNNTVKKVAESYGDNVQFADVHGSLNGMADMASDNLHPSGAGYEKMGKFWAEVIDEYLSGQTEDPNNPEILHSDFENGLSGWQARGGATVATTTAEAESGASSAYVTGRTAAWNGISYALSSRRCPANSLISVQLKVMQKTGSPVNFKLTMQYDNNGSAVYDTFAEHDVASGNWITLSCWIYEIQEGSNPTLYIETDTDLCDFYLDEVLILKSDGTLPYEPDSPGDVNGDHKFNTDDIAMMQKWLLSAPDAQIACEWLGDINEDEQLNVYDLCLMKRMLLKDESA